MKAQNSVLTGQIDLANRLAAVPTNGEKRPVPVPESKPASVITVKVEGLTLTERVSIRDGWILDLERHAQSGHGLKLSAINALKKGITCQELQAWAERAGYKAPTYRSAISRAAKFVRAEIEKTRGVDAAQTFAEINGLQDRQAGRKAEPVHPAAADWAQKLKAAHGKDADAVAASIVKVLKAEQELVPSNDFGGGYTREQLAEAFKDSQPAKPGSK